LIDILGFSLIKDMGSFSEVVEKAKFQALTGRNMSTSRKAG
jgi:hypothetical protein